MLRIHPTENNNEQEKERVEYGSKLTVWKKSSMSFQQGIDGFTAFDHHGKLAFRVDDNTSVTAGLGLRGGRLLLMDGSGNALLTLKPQVFSMQSQWNAYRGDVCSKTNGAKPKVIFSMRSGSILFNGGKVDEAEIFMGGKRQGTQVAPDYTVQGCFRRRNCIIRTGTGTIAARIARKRVNKTVLLGDDVFSLVVEPHFQTEFIIAFVIILDRIHVKTFTPFLCS